MSPEAPGLSSGVSGTKTKCDKNTKNGINRTQSRKTEQTVLSRYKRLKKFRKTKGLVTSEIRAARVRQQSRSYKENNDFL